MCVCVCVWKETCQFLENAVKPTFFPPSILRVLFFSLQIQKLVKRAYLMRVSMMGPGRHGMREVITWFSLAGGMAQDANIMEWTIPNESRICRKGEKKKSATGGWVYPWRSLEAIDHVNVLNKKSKYFWLCTQIWFEYLRREFDREEDQWPVLQVDASQACVLRVEEPRFLLSHFCATTCWGNWSHRPSKSRILISIFSSDD